MVAAAVAPGNATVDDLAASVTALAHNGGGWGAVAAAKDAADAATDRAGLLRRSVGRLADTLRTAAAGYEAADDRAAGALAGAVGRPAAAVADDRAASLLAGAVGRPTAPAVGGRSDGAAAGVVATGAGGTAAVGGTAPW
ncbi:hypothetical protein ACFQX7_23435 [Luedemannella flava]